MKKLFVVAIVMTSSATYAQDFPVAVSYDNVYDTVGDIQLKMDIYQPTGTTGARPLVITIHGGCFTGGDKAEMDYLAEALAKQGMVVANVNYRVAAQAVYPAAHQDVRVALRYMRANAHRYNVDITRSAAIGMSAGSTLAAGLGVEPVVDRNGTIDDLSKRVDVVVNNHGRMDFTHDQYPFDQTYLDCAELYLGMKREANLQAFFDASPINKISAESARFIITHGLNDTNVLPLHSQRMHQRIIEKGGKSTLVMMEGVGHSLPSEAFTLARALVKRDFGMTYQITEDTTNRKRIDAGSGSINDVTNGFITDTYFKGGSVQSYDPVLYPSSIPEAQNVRTSNSTFSYHLPNSVVGLKKVTMSFFEPYNVSVGYRMQDVRFMGVNAFNDLDVVKIMGSSGKAMRQEVYLSTKSRRMSLDFVKKGTDKGPAAVGSIEITPLLTVQ